MDNSRDRLLHMIELLPSIFPDRKVIEAVAERVATWLETLDANPVCTVRSGRTLVIASKQDGKLRLTVSPTLTQLEDSALVREGQGGFSVIDPGSPSTIVEIPLSDISGSEQIT